MSPEPRRAGAGRSGQRDAGVRGDTADSRGRGIARGRGLVGLGVDVRSAVTDEGGRGLAGALTQAGESGD